MRLLVRFGYAGVFALLLTTLLFALLAKYLPGLYDSLPSFFFQTEGGARRIPVAAVVISGLGFVAGWALVLTGASDCRRRVFLLVVGLFLFELLDVVGFVVRDKGFVLLSLVLLLVAAPAAAHLFTRRLRYWRDLALFEFLGWLVVVSVFILMPVFFGALKEAAAYGLNDALFRLVFISSLFFFLFALDVVDLAVDLSRLAILGLRWALRARGLRALTLLVLLVQPLVLVWIIRGRLITGISNKALFTVWGIPIDLVTLILSLLTSVALIAGMVRLMLSHRWTVRAAATLLTLSLAFLVLTFGLLLAYRGTSFAELGLSWIRLFPPAFLFALLMAYDVLNFGVRFANSGGHYMPRSGRALMYLGSAILLIASMLFFLNVREVPFGRADDFVRRFVNLYFAEGVLFLALPYLAWTAWKRWENVVGDTSSDSSYRSATSGDYAPGRHANARRHDALLAGALCGYIGYAATLFIQTNTLIPLSIDIPNFGASWGAVRLTTVVVGIAIALGVTIRYAKGTLSADTIKLLVGAVGGYIFGWIFMGFSP